MAGLLAGCGTPQRGMSELHQEDLHGLATPAPQPALQADGMVARINGEPVSLSEVAPLLMEASGGAILREVALDRGARAQCAAKNVKIDEQAVAAEENRLLESIERGAIAPGERFGALLEAIRKSRGLGEVRYRALLERNAMLRALVRDSVEVTASDVEQAMLIKYGERYRVRIIVMDSERELLRLRGELAKDAAVDVAFARAATLKSNDPSASRGGLLDAISPVDATYPAALRSTLAGLKPGEISPVLAVEKSFAIAMLDSKVGASIPPEDAGEQVRAAIRLRKERLAMEAEARRILATMKISPVSPGLEWSWGNLPTP